MNIYIIGIEGAGTSALAELYRAQGFDVSGSDEGDGFYRGALEKAGITVHEKFDVVHITDDIDVVVYSTAYGEDNIEVQAARAKGIVTQSYPEAVGAMTKEFFTIAVCGTHGKTTTSGMLTHALIGTGRDPRALIGAPVIGWDGGARLGGGKEFVLEADEYQNKLANYTAQAVILTGIDYDHPDFFPDLATYRKAFIDFLVRMPRTGILVALYDDWDVIKSLEGVCARVLTYGEHAEADAVIEKRETHDGVQRIYFSFDGEQHTLEIHMPGKHNALNALAAWLMSAVITGDDAGSLAGVRTYQGVARRFEYRDAFHGTVMIDDYAHHPEAVRSTILATREVYPDQKIIVAFHPHTYTRTKALLHELARALDLADEVIILDIYGSAREEVGGVSAQDLVNAVNQGAQDKGSHIPDVESLATWAKRNLEKSNVFLTLGAGDVYKVHDILRRT